MRAASKSTSTRPRNDDFTFQSKLNTDTNSHVQKVLNRLDWESFRHPEQLLAIGNKETSTFRYVIHQSDEHNKLVFGRTQTADAVVETAPAINEPISNDTFLNLPLPLSLLLNRSQ